MFKNKSTNFWLGINTLFSSETIKPAYYKIIYMSNVFVISKHLRWIERNCGQDIYKIPMTIFKHNMLPYMMMTDSNSEKFFLPERNYWIVSNI